MIPISEALKIIKRETFSLAEETVDLGAAVGRVLAENVKADMDLPPFDRSQMDGFALKFEDTTDAPVKLKIIGESVAGKGFDGKIKSGEAVRIMTGARVPNGANAVQKVELTSESEGFIEISETAHEGQNIVGRGKEIEKGTKVFKKGEIVTAQKIATLASFGYAKVKVFKRPRVTILATGSEIVNIGDTPQKDQIRNCNSLMLKTFAAPFADVRVLPLVKDDLENLKNQIAEIVGLNTQKEIHDYSLHIHNTKFEFTHSRFKKRKPNISESEEKSESGTNVANENQSEIRNPKSEILIITGGVSVGDYDFTKPALQALGAEIFFEKISLKPGKPTVFAKLNDTLIFGLPGNPVSVAVTFFLFARTAILLMQSAENVELKTGYAVCKEKIRGAFERDSVLPVSLSTNKKGKLIIKTLRFSGSSNFVAFAQADALVFVPEGKNIKKGEAAQIYFLD